MSVHVDVVIVDDHSLFRTGVAQSLGLDSGIRVVAEGATGEEAIELARKHTPDVILLDISMPGNGIDAAREIAKIANGPKIVMLTVSEGDDNVIGALEAGAVGYVLKGVGATELIAAVKSVASGNTFVSPNLTMRLLEAVRVKAEGTPLSSLSAQEKRTLRLTSNGMSNREAAEILKVHEKTIKYHMTNIMKKLKVRNRVEAALIANHEWRS